MSERGPKYDRRQYIKGGLAGVGGIALAGCLGDSDSDDTSAVGNGVPDEIVLGVDIPWAPFTYRNTDDEFDGIDIDMLTWIFDEMDQDYTIQEVAFDTFIQNLQNGDFDIFASAVSPTEEREEVIAFSDPHIESWHTAATLDMYDIDSVEDIRGETMAVQSGTLAQDIAEERLGEEMLDGEVSFDAYDDMEGVINALLAGQAVATVTNDLTLQRFMIEHENLELIEDVGPAEEGHDNPPDYVGLRVGEMAYGFRQEDEELVEMINEGIEMAEEEGILDGAIDNHVVTDF